MSYKIPDEAVLEKAIRNAMTRTPHVNSQRELAEVVNRELSKMDSNYRAGGERIRRVGIEKNILKVVIEYHETEGPLPETCPVCRNAMVPLRNMSLEGRVVEVARKCTVCPYKVGQKALMPGRYGFSSTGKREISENEKRIRKLKKAQAKLREASALIDDALRMTELKARSQYAKDALAYVSEAKEQAGSLTNLIADIESIDKEDPGWTRPTVSIKNNYRKDI
ncbi:MAG: hypothetical protein WCQ23_01255 [Candidatus Methanomethylophilaceae archaeon]|jgi:hypothetical protein